MLILDSGLGGISVARAVWAMDAEVPCVYVADTAGFPYGRQSATALAVRSTAILRAALLREAASPIVLACNTLSTLCLEALRAAIPLPFVGTVPAIKTAAQHAKRFTLLATPNTAQSEYTKRLIAEFAPHAVVDCYGAPDLASLIERFMLGEALPSEAVARELEPAFFDDARGRTQAIVLGCTHYPLALEALRAAAPWPVAWVDSSDAIARRALSLRHQPPTRSVAYVTAEADVARYRDLFLREGFEACEVLRLI